MSTKVHNLGSDAINIGLSNTAPVATNTVWSKREAGEAKSVLAGIQAKNDAAQAKLEAAIKVSEGLKALL